MGQENVLNLLDRETAEWFADTLGEPTLCRKKLGESLQKENMR